MGETGVGMNFATKYLREVATQKKAESANITLQENNHLATVARKARDADIRMHDRHLALVERAIKQLEMSEDLSIADLAKLTALRGQHYKLVESITGLDVVKAITISQAREQDGKPVAWDGVEALEVLQLDLLPPDDSEPDLSGLM